MIEILGLALLAGLPLSLMLPGLGLYLRLRNEWLAPLAISQFAALGTLVAGALGYPLPLGAVLLAVAAMGVKYMLASPGPSFYALLLVIGWSAGLLLVSWIPAVQETANALTDGQIYLIGHAQGLWTIIIAVGVMVSLPFLARSLLRSTLFPNQFARRERWNNVLFDALAAVAMVTSTLSLGIMSTFALAFFPAWIAWGYGTSWWRASLIAALIGMTSFLIAFVLAWKLDLPFGPACAFLLAIISVPLLLHRLSRQ